MSQKTTVNLIVSFLALAIIATSATFALVGWRSQKLANEITKNTQEQTSQQQTKTPTIAQNAFVEDIPTTSAANLLPAGSYPIGDNIPPKIEKSDNLTQRFIKQASYQTLKNNPEGPQSGEDGISLIAPDINSILSTSANEIDIEQATQDWQATKKELAIKTVSATDANIQIYATNIKKVTDLYFAGSGIPSLSQQTLSKEILEKTNKNLATFAQKLAEIEVPVTLQEFHKNLLAVVIYQRNAFGFYGQNMEDPVKIILALQTRQSEYTNQLNNLTLSAQKVGILPSKNGEKTALSIVWENTLGPKTAHAFFAWVQDLIAEIQLIKDSLTDIWKWLYNTLLRILVNQIINQMQRDLVNWIGGGGKPKFVTNWKQELSSIGNTAASAIISKAAPKLCQSFGPLVEVALTPVSDITDKESLNITCTLDQVIDNVKDFYNSFSNGGWVAYGAALRPENQMWGVLFSLNDTVARQTTKTVGAAQSAKEAASGFNSGNTTCTNPQDIETTNGEYASGLGELKGSVDIIKTSCDASGKAEETCRVVVCEADDYRINTPGGAVAHGLFGSLNWKPNQIVSAQRIEELVSALIDAAINRLANLAINWATGSGGGGGSDGVSITCSGNNTGPGCGGAINVPGGGPGGSNGSGTNSNGQSQSDIANAAQNKLTLINQAISDYQRLQTLIQTPGKGPVCAAQNSTDISKIQDAFAALNLPQAKQKIQTLISELQNLNASDPNYNQRLFEILDEIKNIPAPVNGTSFENFQNLLTQTIQAMEQCINGTSSSAPPTP